MKSLFANPFFLSAGLLSVAGAVQAILTVLYPHPEQAPPPGVAIPFGLFVIALGAAGFGLFVAGLITNLRK